MGCFLETSVELLYGSKGARAETGTVDASSVIPEEDYTVPIGKAIVRFGERRVLSLEYFSLIFVFLAYTIADSKLLVAALYVADHIFFNFAIAIRTFFQKIGDPRDIAPSMAVGFTINHIGAVVFPVIGGLLWMIDYRIPFVIGAGFALISLVAVQLITGQVKQASEATFQSK